MNYFNSLNAHPNRPANDIPSQIFEWQNNDPRNALQNIYNKSNEDLWIETWLRQNAIYQPIPKLKKITKPTGHLVAIGDAKRAISNCLQLLEKLTVAHEHLQNNVETMSSADWKTKTIEIGCLKDEFTKIMCKFEQADVLKHIKLALEKRKKKRASAKKRKETRRIKSAADVLLRQKLHKDIDQWLSGMKEEAEKAKMEENMKKDADCVLEEVTKKKSDARKQLSLISSLIKLRTVREAVGGQRGEKGNLEDRQAFNITTEKLVKMWESSFKTYATEEQGLRLMLEKNASEDSKAARLAKERGLLEEWQNVLFGPNIVPANNPTYWALTAARRDTETFIAIRKSWDTFLVPPANEMGSRIPVGWVLPEENADTAWQKYLDS